MYMRHLKKLNERKCEVVVMTGRVQKKIQETFPTPQTPVFRKRATRSSHIRVSITPHGCDDINTLHSFFTLYFETFVRDE